MAETPPVDSKLVSLDTLPEDLIVGIFDHLILRDQTRLGACSSRFRSINLHKVFAKFDAVVVFWGDAFLSVNTYECYKALKKAKCFQHGPTDEGQLQVDECTERLFEKAKTNTLEITIKSADDRANRLFSELFKSLHIQFSLEIDFVVSGEQSIPLLQGLMANRNLAKASFIIHWSRATHDDIERTRAFLLGFPIVKSLLLSWAYVSLSTEVITDTVLLYLAVRCREELIVGKGDCTVNGLMEVYEGRIDCHLVRVTVRSEIAREFQQTIEQMKQPDRREFIFLGQNTCLEGIFMQPIVMTKHPEKYEKLN
ncbi:hypothetical protein PRIPAC_82558 [Pristionchus pacificus]|uniref:F-box domain-containing protein n=1 Tax=Pristionchus pacificus TaxID=54126 RepID=A0A2A6CNP4_PRIPA|nr:hypothetical protein PRIPAC_82558 [Pristionchus pacificus]|eukprot:PDM79814.1 hypothetical protein PRIPAC_32393 [Pristionchus pacificus]